MPGSAPESAKEIDLARAIKTRNRLKAGEALKKPPNMDLRGLLFFFFFLTSVPHLKQLSPSMTSPCPSLLLANSKTLQKLKARLRRFPQLGGMARDKQGRWGRPAHVTTLPATTYVRVCVRTQDFHCTGRRVQGGNAVIYSLGPVAFTQQLFWQRRTSTAVLPGGKDGSQHAKSCFGAERVGCRA